MPTCENSYDKLVVAMKTEKKNGFIVFAGILFLLVSAVLLWQRVPGFLELYHKSREMKVFLEFVPPLGMMLASMGFLAENRKLSVVGCCVLLLGCILDAAGLCSMPFGEIGTWLLFAAVVLVLMAMLAGSGLSVFLGIVSAILSVLLAVYFVFSLKFDMPLRIMREGLTGSLLQSVYVEPFKTIAKEVKKAPVNYGRVAGYLSIMALSIVYPLAAVLYGIGIRKPKAAAAEPAAEEKTSLEEVPSAEKAAPVEVEETVDVAALIRGDAPAEEKAEEKAELTKEVVSRPAEPAAVAVQPKSESRGGSSTFRKFSSVLCALLGIVIVLFGYKMDQDAVNHAESLRTYSYDAGSYYVPYASFGGDFYTYMYNASDTIVDELDDMNKGMEQVVAAEANIQKQVTANARATDALTHAVYMLIIAVGCGIFAAGLISTAGAFEKSREDD